jgi:hypothetical protein
MRLRKKRINLVLGASRSDSVPHLRLDCPDKPIHFVSDIEAGITYRHVEAAQRSIEEMTSGAPLSATSLDTFGMGIRPVIFSSQA